MEQSERKLLKAAENGDTAEVRELIRRGVKKDVQDWVRFYSCFLKLDNSL